MRGAISWQWARAAGLWASMAMLCAVSMCSCGGSDIEPEAANTGTAGASSTSSAASTPAVALALVVGPGTGEGHTFNRARISIDVCAPGGSPCQRVDHVIVDSGSTGLRLNRSALDPALAAALPAKRAADGRPLAECARFSTTYLWGTVNSIDLRLGARSARGALAQLVDDVASVPGDCSHQGEWSRLDLRAESSNGIIGLGSVLGDEGRYYECNGSGCDGSAMALPGVQGLVRQPLSLLDADANGYIVELPAVGQGRSVSITGRLLLGVGTRADNGLAGHVFPLDGKGSLGNASIDGRDMGPLVLDTGLAYHWLDDDSVASCEHGGYYCPVSATTRVVQVGVGELAFQVLNADRQLSVGSLAVYAGLAHRRDAATGGGIFLGLPFYFGRRVIVGLPGASVAMTNGGGTVDGPFIAIENGAPADPDRLALGEASPAGSGSR